MLQPLKLIRQFSSLATKSQHKGAVFSLKDNISHTSGLTGVKLGELVYDNNNNIGMVMNLERYGTGIVMLSTEGLIAGSSLYRTFALASIQTTFLLFGNVINVLGSVQNLSSLLVSYTITWLVFCS
jgi:F0F1-type ATP synthase alpha subunit